MKTCILICFVLLSVSAIAQQFVNTSSVGLPDSVASAKVEWVDLDNDGLLDVFVFATHSTGQHFFVTYKMDTVQGLTTPHAFATDFKASVHRLVDFDRDNDLDVIVSGLSGDTPSTTFFENSSDFEFAAHASIPVRASAIHFADVNSNGPGELILSGHAGVKPFLHIYEFGSVWKLRNDSLQLEATSLEIVDIDGDSDNDIFVSGKENGLNTAIVLLNQGAFWFKKTSLSKVVNGQTAVGDLNHDGRLDIFATGVNAASHNVSIQYLNQGGSFVAKDTLSPLADSRPFLADFNSDGKCDIQVLGKNVAGDTVNTIAVRDSIAVNINSSTLHDQAFGDYDRDGDLDLLQLTGKANTLLIQLAKNDLTRKNLGPLGPSGAFGFTIFNKLFLYWDKALDDHTPQKAITYDVTIFTPNQELTVGEFDLISNKRLTVSNGNSGTRNYLLLKPKTISTFNYAVQPIDNAFESYRNSNDPRNPGLCKGTGTPCSSQEVVEVAACKNEDLMFTAGADAQWFSLSKGFLSEGASFEMKAVASDTIFSFSMMEGCPSLKVYLIQLRQNFIRKTIETRFVCEGQTITLQVASGWTTIQWKSHVRGNQGTTASINFTVTQPDTITVHAVNESGCGIQHKTAFRISKPLITLYGEIYQILKGESVQLSASGGETYQWAPAESLDNSTISDPTASPVTSTTYTVTASDSIGCVASANVHVRVEGTAFIPNLFTPNDDGKNDEIKVYGLSTVSNFRIVIQNREGKTVYDTKDVGQASANGWDGTANGVKQPAGVYYWKIKGEHPSGRKLLLNGKATGSIVLIR